MIETIFSIDGEPTPGAPSEGGQEGEGDMGGGEQPTTPEATPEAPQNRFDGEGEGQEGGGAPEAPQAILDGEGEEAPAPADGGEATPGA